MFLILYFVFLPTGFSLCAYVSVLFLQSVYISLLLHLPNTSYALFWNPWLFPLSPTSQACIESRIHVCVCVCVHVCMDGWVDGCRSGAHVEPIICGGERNWGPMRVKHYYLWLSLKQGSFLRESSVCESPVTDILNTFFVFFSISSPVLFFKLLLLSPTPFTLSIFPGWPHGFNSTCSIFNSNDLNELQILDIT